MDESIRREPVSSFHCGERFEQTNDPEEEDQLLQSVVFVCHLPTNNTLEFACREPSCGALFPNETSVETDSQQVDPNFFDAGYTLAAKTGFQVWTGTRFLLETLLFFRTSDVDRLQHVQNSLPNANVLELGAGVGVVGVSLASVGANVLLTDLPTLVEHAITPNLIRNETTATNKEECPEWLKECSNVVSIHDGWAAATFVDWNQPVDEQLTPTQVSHVDLIVASDCIFLVSMLTSLLDTVAEIFTSSPKASLLLSFQRRDAKDGDESTSFTTVNRVIREVKARKWSIECLAWRPVVVGNEMSQVLVFEIRQQFY